MRDRGRKSKRRRLGFERQREEAEEEEVRI